MQSDRLGEPAAMAKAPVMEGLGAHALPRLEPGEHLVQRPGHWRAAATAAMTAAYSAAGLFLFVLALQLLKTGAAGLRPVLKAVSADGVPNLLGFGWLGAYGVMSGSPVAAISLSLYSGGTISDGESFAMLNGSR